MSLAIHGASGRPKPDEPASPIRQAAPRNAVNREALSRLPELDIGELRQQWRSLHKAEAPRYLRGVTRTSSDCPLRDVP
jgi:hypothetical protein